MDNPKELRYTNTHEWVRVEGETCVVGITHFAQQQLSDLTYVELPAVGDQVAAGDEVAVVESVKAASDIYAPVAGTILAINEDLAEKPEVINEDPFAQGWLFKLTPDQPGDVENLLMDVTAYDALMPDGG